MAPDAGTTRRASRGRKLDNAEAVDRVKQSDGIERFVKQLFRMRELGLQDATRGRRFKPTVPDTTAARPVDLVDRDFTAPRPNSSEEWGAILGDQVMARRPSTA